jgi:transcriptional regulator with XRE-family HTH domain
MILGQRLKQLRKQRGLSQQEVANRLKINRVTYSQYEVNRRQPDYETLNKIADFYQVSLDYLVGRTDDPQGTVDHKNFKVTTDIIEFLEKSNDLHVGGQKLSEKQRKILIDFMKSVVAPRLQDQDKQED